MNDDTLVCCLQEVAALLDALGRHMRAKNNMDSVMLSGQILQTLCTVPCCWECA